MSDLHAKMQRHIQVHLMSESPYIGMLTPREGLAYTLRVLELHTQLVAALEETEAGLRVVMSETFDRDEATTIALGRMADELAAALRAAREVATT